MPRIIGPRARRRLAGAALLIGLGLAAPAAAQQPAGIPQGPAEIAAQRAAARAIHEAELRDLEANARAASDAKSRAEAEAATLKSDRAKLNAALLETGERVRAAENRAMVAEERLVTLRTTEDAIRRSLASRQGVIVEVLAALQRLGRRPPPAVLARAEDMLQAVRTAILLGAVLPELKAEAETLAGDLAELVRLRDNAGREREAVSAELRTLADERTRLAALVEARQQQIAAIEGNAASESERAAGIAARAQSVRELIDSLDREIAEASRRAEAARQALETQSREVREQFAAAAFRDPARLAPKVAFEETRGLLPLPVSGAMTTPFGAPDGFGGTTRGITFVTRPKALVSAPADAWVQFAGPFRSFGKMLILNAGSGHYIVMSGLERIDVALNQFVLAGEPLGAMGETAAPAGAVSDGDRSGPLLYVEFRKDGVSIDPGPWWAKPAGTRSAGDRRSDVRSNIFSNGGEKVRG